MQHHLPALSCPAWRGISIKYVIPDWACPGFGLFDHLAHLIFFKLKNQIEGSRKVNRQPSADDLKINLAYKYRFTVGFCSSAFFFLGT